MQTIPPYTFCILLSFQGKVGHRFLAKDCHTASLSFETQTHKSHGHKLTNLSMKTIAHLLVQLLSKRSRFQPWQLQQRSYHLKFEYIYALNERPTIIITIYFHIKTTDHETFYLYKSN